MKLLKRENCGKGFHRSGWPDAMAAVESIACETGVLLDDCVEQTFLFGPDYLRKPHTEPWVGIFHFPHVVDSPYPLDRSNNSAGTFAKSATFNESLPLLRGGITLCESLAKFWADRTGKPFVALKHPTATDVPQWSEGMFQSNRLLIQLGYHLRDTRAIYHVHPKDGWKYARIEFYQDYQRERDASLKRLRPVEVNDRVQEWCKLPDASYDATMTSCIVLSKSFGASACNVTVECIARGTPILCERRPETEEYLGSTYPLYIDECELDDATISAASRHIATRRGDWLKCEVFAQKVLAFCDSI